MWLFLHEAGHAVMYNTGNTPGMLTGSSTWTSNVSGWKRQFSIVGYWEFSGDKGDLSTTNPLSATFGRGPREDFADVFAWYIMTTNDMEVPQMVRRVTISAPGGGRIETMQQIIEGI